MRKTSALQAALFLAAVVTASHPAQAARDIADGVCETTSTTGTGAVDLEGALTGGHRTFVAAVGNGAQVPYHIQNGDKLETGWGVVTDAAPDTLTRVADWSTDGVGVELTLIGTSTVCIGTIKSYFTGGDGFGVNADLLDGLNSTDFLRPVGEVIDYAGATCPANYLEAAGQTVSQVTYAALYAVLGTIYGSDAGGNFTLPDLRGRVVAGEDDMGGTSANRLTNADDGLNGDVLGATGGDETQALAAANNAPHTHTGTTDSADPDPDVRMRVLGTGGGIDDTRIATTWTGQAANDTLNLSRFLGGADMAHTHTFTTNSQGSGAAFGIAQPTIVMKKCIYAGA